MSKKSLHFIINPISGTGKQKGIEQKIEKEINSDLFDVCLHYTQEAGHASRISKELVELSADIVVAVGGDGTVNEVAQALVHSTTVLAIIPLGSGNGLSRHLGIPQNTRKAIRHINQFNVKKIDSCTANGLFFINVSGIGFDGHISNWFAKEKKRGMKTYVKLILSKWSSYTTVPYKITINDKVVYHDSAVLVSFANASQYGNNVIISPQSEVNDGVMELCILKSFRYYEIFSLIFALLTKQLHEHKLVQVIPCSEALIESAHTEVHLDGEPKDLGSTLHLKIKPSSIQLICNEF